MHMTTKALVLRSVDYKDSDKILTLLTQEQGKLTASARGSRKKGSAIAHAAANCCVGRSWCSTTARAAGR